VCDRINNIDNIGMLFRNAAAFAIDCVVLSPDCHDPLYRKSLRVSIGHALRIPYHRSRDWARTLEELKHHQLMVIGTSLDSAAIPLDDVIVPHRTALVVGSEFNGLGKTALDSCDLLVRVPMAAGTDSLNVGVAAAVCLHRFARKNRG
jgi:tRNA G18 (ribose-2'-O)-methylase SpoU